MLRKNNLLAGFLSVFAIVIISALSASAQTQNTTPRGGTVTTGNYGGKVYQGPNDGTAAKGPRGRVAVQGPNNRNAYRGIYGRKTVHGENGSYVKRAGGKRVYRKF